MLPVAVVVVTRNRASTLDRALQMVGALPDRPRVVVVDNGSTDGTPALVRERHPNVHLVQLTREPRLRRPHRRGSAGRRAVRGVQ